MDVVDIFLSTIAYFAFGCLAASHYASICNILPAIHGSFFALVISRSIPLLMLASCLAFPSSLISDARKLTLYLTIATLALCICHAYAIIPLFDLISLCALVLLVAIVPFGAHRYSFFKTTFVLVAASNVFPLLLHTLPVPAFVTETHSWLRAVMLCATVASIIVLRAPHVVYDILVHSGDRRLSDDRPGFNSNTSATSLRSTSSSRSSKRSNLTRRRGRSSNQSGSNPGMNDVDDGNLNVNTRSSSSRGSLSSSSLASSSQSNSLFIYIKPIMFILIISVLCTISSLGTRFYLKQIKHSSPSSILPKPYKLIAQRRSITGLISVVEKHDSHCMLTADLSVLGGVFTKGAYENDSIFGQFHVHEAIQFSRRPTNSTNTLCLGVGVGIVSRALHRHGMNVNAIELDGVIAQYAYDYFNFPSALPIHVDDGIHHLSTVTNAYDFIVHDAFSGGFIHPSLLSQHHFHLLASALSDDGVLAINIVSSTALSPRFLPTHLVASVVAKRLKRAFEYVRAFSDGHQAQIDNIVFFASNHELALRFRQPVKEDVLDSRLRNYVFDTFWENEINVNKIWSLDTITRTEQPLEQSLVSRVTEKVRLWLGMAAVGIVHARLMDKVHSPYLWPALVAAEAFLD